MSTNSTSNKKILYILLSVVFVALLGFAIFRLTRPAAPSPEVTETSTEQVILPAEETETVATSEPVPTMEMPTEQAVAQPTESDHDGMDMSGAAPLPKTVLDPLSIPKYVTSLVIPPAMPSEGQSDWNGEGELATEYWIAARQFEQQVLPEGFPMTTVWGYGRYGDPLPGSGEPTTFNYPAFTVDVQSNDLVRVVWVNQLVDDPDSASPNFLPSLTPIDQTIHWASPMGMDPMEGHGADTTPYLGPIPLVPHVHGAHVPAISDGFPEAWFLPAAGNIPEGLATQGPYYDSVHEAPAGAAVFEYPNTQRAMTIWYHDHTLGITRNNVYAGLAGFWLIHDETEAALNLPGPYPKAGDTAGTAYYDIPIVIQDRTFSEDGSLWYPDSREYFDGYSGPYKPDTDVAPIWNPEFFGNTILVNGNTWPYLEVEPRLYRLRFLNGANSRFMLLQFDQQLAFNMIGNEGGFLPGQPLVLDQLLLAPAERADVIVDFSQFQPGDEITLLNLGPDSPFGTLPVDPADQANPETTGQVMQFRVVELTDQGNPGEIPAELPAVDPLTTTLPARDLTLNEEMNVEADVPIEALLGTAAEGALEWSAEITETPTVGDTEIWRIINLTADAHPIHLHLVHFQVLDRTPFDKDEYMEAQDEYLEEGGIGEPPDPYDFATGDPIPAEAWEAGWKETVIASPDMITRIIANFDMEGLYVWHCHILEHEDNEMMRPFQVLPR
jgi:FtsP/CotA-like multicopper oxidase with cupredoxin domain